jgi:hypothetical protein
LFRGQCAVNHQQVLIYFIAGTKIALFPHKLVFVFSASAVVDYGNMLGLGTKEKPPLIAILEQKIGITPILLSFFLMLVF